ncbi:MAG: hypothetical protein HFE97_09670 [Oscillospiraceae bacterium]|nr:hypothetical protein [Oscillospiraceae bacterium]
MNQKEHHASERHIPLWLKLILVLAVVVGVFFLRQYVYAAEEAQRANPNNGIVYATPVADDHPTLVYFNEQVPGREILFAFEEDLTDDGLNELVVLYHNPEEGRKNWMVALINRGDGTYDITSPTPAPIENQLLRFFEMDKAPPLEFVLTGEKDGEVGYAIYRIIDGELINLFGENMEDCC